MKIYLPLLIITIAFYSSISRAQTFDLKGLATSKKSYYIDYIGGSKDYYFVFASSEFVDYSARAYYNQVEENAQKIIKTKKSKGDNKFLKFDDNYKFIEEYELSFEYPMEQIIEMHVYDEMIYIFYRSYLPYKICLEKYDLDGNSQGAEVLHEDVKYISFSSSDDGELIAFIINKVFHIYSKSGKKLKEIKCPESELISHILMNDGSVYYLAIDNETPKLVETDGQNRKELNIKIGHTYSEYSLHLDAHNNNIYITSLLGFKGENKAWTSGHHFGDKTKFVGSAIKKVDLNTFKLVSSKEILFTDNTKSKCLTDEKREFEGLIYLSNSGLVFVNDEPIQKIYKKWTHIESAPGSTNGTTQVYYSKYGSVIFMNMNSTKQTVFELDHMEAPIYNFILPCLTHVEGDRLYAFYYEKTRDLKTGYTLHEKILNKDLDVIDEQKHYPYMKSKTYLKIDEIQQLDKNSYIMLSRARKQVGITILDFD